MKIVVNRKLKWGQEEEKVVMLWDREGPATVDGVVCNRNSRRRDGGLAWPAGETCGMDRHLPGFIENAAMDIDAGIDGRGIVVHDIQQMLEQGQRMYWSVTGLPVRRRADIATFRGKCCEDI